MDEAFQIKCEDLALSITLVTNHLKIFESVSAIKHADTAIKLCRWAEIFSAALYTLHAEFYSHSIVMPGVELSCAYAYFKVNLTSCLLIVHIETRKNASKCLTF